MARRKTVLITGCGPTGIGRAMAAEFQLRGHRVIATGLNEDLLAPLAEMGMETVVMDVTSEASAREAAAQVARLLAQGEAEGKNESSGSGRGLGKLDILVNNAGVLHIMPFTDTPVSEARRVFDVNFFGVMIATQAFLPLMIAATNSSSSSSSSSSSPPPSQSIVANVSSINAVLNPPFFSFYNASKAAVTSMGTTLRRELAPLGVRVVTLVTGNIRTELFAHAGPGPGSLPAGSWYAAIAPWIEGRGMLMGPSMSPEDYARGVVTELLRDGGGGGSWIPGFGPAKVVWRGGLATLAWFLSWFGLDGTLDGTMYSQNGLDKVKIA
ncbi:hypothetical protein BX600DRAFT_203720 [Xylariales sp. PMI_506]|nr:hypothetical protein BX600DRAFT_203720 [Xylariales sp. PMI_506]